MSTPTFAELLDSATKGPCFWETWYGNADRVAIVTDREIVALMGNGGIDAATMPNAELITRLLNFAHAGGVEAINECLRLLDTGGLECGPSAKLAAKKELHVKLRRVADILDGGVQP